jgi:ElaB/YqjD/DUF883 family membrane-anchored ribosome-binding protein
VRVGIPLAILFGIIPGPARLPEVNPSRPFDSHVLNGEPAVATATNEVDEIRRRMAQIRHELHQDVKEVVEGAEEVTDWRRYVRLYPWAAVGATSAAGCIVTYLIVPRRRPGADRDGERPAEVRVIRESDLDSKKRRKSLIGAAFGMVAPLAWRAVQNYAMGYLEQWIAQQQQQYMASTGPVPEPPPRPSGQPGGPPPGGPQNPRRQDRPGGPGYPGGLFGS